MTPELTEQAPVPPTESSPCRRGFVPVGTISNSTITLVAIVGVVYLYSISVPGSILFLWFPCVLVMPLVLLLCVWLLVRCIRNRRGGITWRVTVIPAIGGFVLATALLDVPLRVRFELARSEFDSVASEAITYAEQFHARCPPDLEPKWIGTFQIDDAWLVPEGLILFERHGNFLDNAGFAYLPHGSFPSPNSSFECPRFRSLGGYWYAFTASW